MCILLSTHSSYICLYHIYPFGMAHVMRMHRSLIRPVQSVQSLNSYVRYFALYKSKSKKTARSKVPQVVRNEGIQYPEVRVVYNDENGENMWKILTRDKAIQFAQSKSMDLILVNENSRPPVCKLDLYSNVVGDIQKREAEARKQARANVVKEVIVGALIASHDLGIKMNKVKEFLDKGLQVKVTIFAKKRQMREHPLAMDETTLRVLEYIEEFVGVVQPLSRLPNRADFLLSPKKES